MQAAFLTAPRTIEVRQVEQPTPHVDELLIRVGSCGVCGSDMMLYKEGRIGEVALAEPHILGHEFGGTVEAAGSAEWEPLVGRKVAIEPALPCMKCEVCLAGNQNCCPHVRFFGLPPTQGAYCEYVTWPGWLCEPVPDSFTHDQIAALEPLAIAVHVLDLAKPGLGRSAAILGAGMVGQMILEVAKQFHFSPLIVTDRFDYRLDMARAAGATHTVNVERDDPVAAVMNLTGGRGVDFTFEATNSVTAPAQAIGVTTHAGKIFLAGINHEDRIEFSNGLSRRRGHTIYCIRRSRRTLARAIGLFERGALDLDRVLTHRFPLNQLGEAFELAADYDDNVLKAMIAIGS